MNLNPDDNIIAISTPSGRSYRAIIRLSGKGVFSYLKSIFMPDSGSEVVCEKGFRSHNGFIYLEKEKVRIPACVYIMKTPNSYTREDVLEIHTFGSPPLLEMIMETLLMTGSEGVCNENNDEGITRHIRIAEPGEFTRRAFLNGRISLAEAESVIHIIRSRTDSDLLMAVSNLKGRLTELINRIQVELMNLCAGIEAAIDFYDQDIELISFDDIVKNLEQIMEKLRVADINGKKPGISRYGVKTVLAGFPNAGKSSLFNKLLNRERAIVTHVSGTTRDMLEANVVLEGVDLRIRDTAGITHGNDGLETMIAQRTYDTMEDAQIVLFVLDGSVELGSEQIKLFNSIAAENKIIVLNKSDLKQKIFSESLPLEMKACPVIKTSVFTGEGLDTLKKTVISSILESNIDISASDIVFTMRQKVVVRRALEILKEILTSLNEEVNYELVAIDLRRAMDTIGEITGAVLTEDILDIIFSDFCIGK